MLAVSDPDRADGDPGSAAFQITGGRFRYLD